MFCFLFQSADFFDMLEKMQVGDAPFVFFSSESFFSSCFFYIPLLEPDQRETLLTLLNNNCIVSVLNCQRASVLCLCLQNLPDRQKVYLCVWACGGVKCVSYLGSCGCLRRREALKRSRQTILSLPLRNRLIFYSFWTQFASLILSLSLCDHFASSTGPLGHGLWGVGGQMGV